MPFQLVIEKQAEKELLSIKDKALKERIGLKIAKLKDNPYPADSVILKGNAKGFRRLRIGKYRVVYVVDGQTICIVLICLRDKVYKMFQQMIWG